MNHATASELMTVSGIGPATAERIIRHRPYFSAHQVVEERVLREQPIFHLKGELVDANEVLEQ